MSDMKLALRIVGYLGRGLFVDESDGDSKYDIYPYINGREKGLAIVINENAEYENNKVIIVSENRNSDDLVIYEGRLHEVKENYVPSETMYQKRKYFSPSNSRQAVNYLKEKLGMK